jgi:hypothetical protein
VTNSAKPKSTPKPRTRDPEKERAWQLRRKKRPGVTICLHLSEPESDDLRALAVDAETPGKTARRLLAKLFAGAKQIVHSTMAT